MSQDVAICVVILGLVAATLWLLLTLHAARADLAECREVRVKQTAALGAYRADLQGFGEALAKQPPAREVETQVGVGSLSVWRSSAAAASAAKWATVVACCRAVCPHCKSRVKYEDHGHKMPGSGHWRACEAQGVRDAYPKESQAASPGVVHMAPPAVCGEAPARDVPLQASCERPRETPKAGPP